MTKSIEAFQLAEQKIEEVRQSGAKNLDLSGGYDEKKLKLTELPESLGQLTQLQTLNLSSNQLTTLPESLSQLTQLQSLNLSGNQLAALPESLGQLTQLQSLDLSSNQLTALPESLGQFTQLQSLNLSGNQLGALPESLGRLTQLRSLTLSSNQLTALPESLGRLTQLETLNLSENQLTGLPESLGQLTLLKSLVLGPNPLGDIPAAVSRLKSLRELRLWKINLRALPEWLGHLPLLETLWLGGNHLTELPDWFGRMTNLRELTFGGHPGGNPLNTLPESLRRLRFLKILRPDQCGLTSLPDWIAELTRLEHLDLSKNLLSDLPSRLGKHSKLRTLELLDNPLNPELAAANKEGLDAVKRYLRAKSEAQVVLNEAKLILIGEGEVGKSCLLGALRGDPWEESRPTTHGIEIKPVKVTDPATGKEITLNGWDFGGQRVYRPTHQLFFSAPAVYLVVWKPREGPQQGFVKEWIKLVKHREPEAKIIVVATHGGPKERQPDIDRQEIWDLFGKETVIDFFLVQSRPDETTGERRGIAELRDAIARVAASLPEMGRTFPKHWQEARTTLRGLLSRDAVLPLLGPLVRDEEGARRRLERLSENRLCIERALGELGDLVLDKEKAREELSNAREAYLPLDRVFAICKEHKVEEEDARLLLRICRRVGDLIHYEHDPALRNIVVLKPDWLATAMSFVLDDEQTRKLGHGLVSFERLGQLWNNPDKPAENRYLSNLHPIFVRLMERFDLCYRVAEVGRTDVDGTSLIAQLVPDVRPDPVPGWPNDAVAGDAQQVQVCRIVDATNNQSANTEGLFYQLIVRLHKYSLGRADYAMSVHWQRGLVLEDDTGARAFLEHIGNDVRITVRSPYPERFLSALTYDVQWLVEYFWRGVRCEVTVPCLTINADGQRCSGLFDVKDLIDDLRDERPEQKCLICKKWLKIEHLLHNAPAARPSPMLELLAKHVEVKATLEAVRAQLGTQHGELIGRFDRVDAASKETVSKVEAAYSGLMHTLLDEAKEGPRLFSLQPVDPGFFDRPQWIAEKFRLTLWCEHSRLPLPFLNKGDMSHGIYEFDVPRDWFVKAAPFLKTLTGILSLALPVASSAFKLGMDEVAYKAMEKQLDFGQKSVESVLKGGEMAMDDLGGLDEPGLPEGKGIRAHGAVLRQLQAWLKEKDPGFGGLVRVQNKRQEFLWVHPQFEKEY